MPKKKQRDRRGPEPEYVPSPEEIEQRKLELRVAHLRQKRERGSREIPCFDDFVPRIYKVNIPAHEGDF